MGSMKCLLKKNPRAKYYIEAERLSWGSYTLFPTPPPLPTAYPVPTGFYNVFQVLSTTKRESIGEITTEKPMIHCVASWWARGSSLPATQMEGCIQKAKSPCIRQLPPLNYVPSTSVFKRAFRKGKYLFSFSQRKNFKARSLTDTGSAQEHHVLPVPFSWRHTYTHKLSSLL